jgi:hypothetical protein
MTQKPARLRGRAVVRRRFDGAPRRPLPVGELRAALDAFDGGVLGGNRPTWMDTPSTS